MRNLFACFLFFVFVATPNLFAQTPKKVLVEHFTNTRCSICASRNPGFYNNLKSNPFVMHVAYHPSAPYSACLLNNYNIAENDARTNFYGVYGSTPRLVINGNVIASGADYNSSALFSAYQSQWADFKIGLSQNKTGNDSITTIITITKVNTTNYDSAFLFAGIFEDTIFYASPNGESKHFDVFRNAYFGAQGMRILLPKNVGDSIIINKTIALATALNEKRIYTMAMLQKTNTKELLQVERTATLGNTWVSGMNVSSSKNGFHFYPNPAKKEIFLSAETPELKEVQILNSLGQEVFRDAFVDELKINIEGLNSGIYFISVSGQMKQVGKLVIQ